jgi:hypothetical protein
VTSGWRCGAADRYQKSSASPNAGSGTGAAAELPDQRVLALFKTLNRFVELVPGKPLLASLNIWNPWITLGGKAAKAIVPFGV